MIVLCLEAKIHVGNSLYKGAAGAGRGAERGPTNSFGSSHDECRSPEWQVCNDGRPE